MATETSPPPASANVTPPERPWGVTGEHDSVWPTGAHADLLRAALMPDDRGLAAWQRIRDSIDQSTLDGAPAALLPQLARNLRGLGVDDPQLTLFEGVRRYTWARNQLLLTRCQPIISDLERAGITCALFKGAALTRAGQSGLRGMSDVDVLVPPGTQQAAMTLIVRHGLQPLDPLPVWYLADYGDVFRHSANFTDGQSTELDLHWGLLQDANHPDLAEAALAAAQPAEIRGALTRVLCPADELLVALVHGQRFHPTPTYRWILDATLILRGESGEVDLDRLVRLARRHRLEQIVRVGLEIVRDLEFAPVPDSTLAALRRPAPLLRAEQRALLHPSSTQTRLERATLRHMAELRRRLPPGRPVTPVGHLRVAYARSSRRIGPGRPLAFNQAAIGTGTASPAPTPWGERIDLGDADVVRAHCRYGLWLPEDWGSWIAGREAALTVTLPEPPGGPMHLELGAGGVPGISQRLEVYAGDRQVAELVFDDVLPAVAAVHLVIDAESVVDRRLDLRFRSSRALIPLAAGLGEDHRPLGGALTFLLLRPYHWLPTDG